MQALVAHKKIKKHFFSIKTRAILWGMLYYAARFAAILAIGVYGFGAAVSGTLIFCVAVGILPFSVRDYFSARAKTLKYLIGIAKNDNSIKKIWCNLFHNYAA